MEHSLHPQLPLPCPAPPHSGKWEYELHLRPDLYTGKHTQWFYFGVRNMRPGRTYRFTIVNFYKAGSLYNKGMRPLMYSERQAAKGVGWRRVGSNIKYFKTNIRWDGRGSGRDGKSDILRYVVYAWGE